MTKYTITGVDRAGKRFIINTNTPQHYNIWKGTLWLNNKDGTRKRFMVYYN